MADRNNTDLPILPNPFAPDPVSGSGVNVTAVDAPAPVSAAAVTSNSNPTRVTPELPPSVSVNSGDVSASSVFSSSEVDPVDFIGAGRREGRLSERLPAESTGSAQAVCSSPFKAACSRTNSADPGMAGFDIDFEYEVAALEAQWLRDGIIMNARTFFTEAANSICPDSNSSA